MSDLELHLHRLFEWIKTLDGCPESWSDTFIVEDPEFELRCKTWDIPKESLLSIKQYEDRFSQLLQNGYSWININFGGVYQDKGIVFVEYPRGTSEKAKGKTSVNLSGPEGSEWDLSKKLRIIE